MSSAYIKLPKTKNNNNNGENSNDEEWIPYYRSSYVSRPTNWATMIESGNIQDPGLQQLMSRFTPQQLAEIRAREAARTAQIAAEEAAERAAQQAQEVARQQAAARRVAQFQAVRQAAEEASVQRAAEEQARQQAIIRAQEEAAQARRQQQISAETGQMRALLRRLNAKAAAAPLSLANPQPGDFKKNASGQLYVWKRPLNASGQKLKARWMPVSKNTDYETDLQKYYNRITRIGRNYQSRRRDRRQSRKTRKQRK